VAWCKTKRRERGEENRRVRELIVTEEDVPCLSDHLRRGAREEHVHGLGRILARRQREEVCGVHALCPQILSDREMAAGKHCGPTVVVRQATKRWACSEDKEEGRGYLPERLPQNSVGTSERSTPTRSVNCITKPGGRPLRGFGTPSMCHCGRHNVGIK